MPIIYTGGAILAMVIIGFGFLSLILYTLTALFVAPGVLITTVLFNLLSKNFISEDIWISSVVISIMFLITLRYFYPTKYLKIYLCTIMGIGLVMGTYNVYVNANNPVMYTIKMMHTNSFMADKPTLIQNKGTVVGENVNLRATADSNAQIVGSLSKNEIVTIEKESNEWVLIRDKNYHEGWMSKEFIIKK